MKHFSLAFFLLLFIAASCLHKTDNKPGLANQPSKLNASLLPMDSVEDADGKKIYLHFDIATNTLTVLHNNDRVTMKQQLSSSGVRYAGNGYEYEEWQGEVRLLKNGKIVFENKTAVANRSTKNTFNITTNTFVSSTGDSVTITYDDSGEKLFATIFLPNEPMQTLAQTENWAKGAVYKNEKVVWTVFKDKATLLKNGQTLELKKVGL